MLNDVEEECAINLTAAIVGEEYFQLYISKVPCRDSVLTGNGFVREVLDGHPIRCYEIFRMDKHIFSRLCDILKERGWLKNIRYMWVEEQLAIFLLIIGHNERNRMMQERFQHSGETISRHFNNVLKAMVKLAREIIIPPLMTSTPPEISTNPKYNRWLKDCIGVIDETHIDAIIPVDKQIPYRGRKGTVTQNVMTVCSFDMRFTFLYAGWEGTANDSRILLEAINNKRLNFPHALTRKYYVVDAGYPNMTGFLAPFRGSRYHLQDYRGGRSPTNPKELFNHAHSSLRNVIERCFGVLKARFPILKRMASYSFLTQRDIVKAACAVHNFIRQETQRDTLFGEYEVDDLVIDSSGSEHDDIATNVGHLPQQQQEMGAFRKSLANAMWISYNNSEE